MSDPITQLSVAVAEIRGMVEPLSSVPERMARVEERVDALTKSDDALFKKIDATSGPDWKILTPAIVGALAALALLADRVSRAIP